MNNEELVALLRRGEESYYRGDVQGLVDIVGIAISSISAGYDEAKDAERLDWLEDPAECYWVSVQRSPDGKHIRSGQGKGLRSAIDLAIKESKS
jgi:hypothetical protein